MYELVGFCGSAKKPPTGVTLLPRLQMPMSGEDEDLVMTLSLQHIDKSVLLNIFCQINQEAWLARI